MKKNLIYIVLVLLFILFYFAVTIKPLSDAIGLFAIGLMMLEVINKFKLIYKSVAKNNGGEGNKPDN